jgi:hypothetical protein
MQMIEQLFIYQHILAVEMEYDDRSRWRDRILKRNIKKSKERQITELCDVDVYLVTQKLYNILITN